MEIVAGEVLLSEAGFVERFSERDWASLTDNSGDGNPDADVVAVAITDTLGLIARYLGQQYSLPLQAMPLDLERHAYNLFRRVLYRNDPNDEVVDGWVMAEKWLGRVATGKELLVLASGGFINPLQEPTTAKRGRVERNVVFGAKFTERYNRLL